MNARQLATMYAQLGKLEEKNDIEYGDRLTEWDSENSLYVPQESTTDDMAHNRLGFLIEREAQQIQTLESFRASIEKDYIEYVAKWRTMSFDDILSRLDVMNGIQRIYYYFTDHPGQEHLAQFEDPIGILLEYVQDQCGDTSDESLESYVEEVETRDYAALYDRKEAFKPLDDYDWSEIDNPPNPFEQDSGPCME